MHCIKDWPLSVFDSLFSCRILSPFTKGTTKIRETRESKQRALPNRIITTQLYVQMYEVSRQLNGNHQKAIHILSEWVWFTKSELVYAYMYVQNTQWVINRHYQISKRRVCKSASTLYCCHRSEHWHGNSVILNGIIAGFLSCVCVCSLYSFVLTSACTCMRCCECKWMCNSLNV